MKRTLMLILNLAALLAAGCTSAPTHVDKGPIQAKTYSFIPSSANVPVGFSDPREPIHKLIHASIDRNLAAKGLSRLDSGGDLTVAYLVIVGNNGTTESINTYFGYNRDVSELHDKAQDAYSGSKNPNYFEAGTLLIDLIDAKTFKLLQRSYAVRPVLSNPTAEVRAENIQQAVDEALKNVRIGR